MPALVVECPMCLGTGKFYVPTSVADYELEVAFRELELPHDLQEWNVIKRCHCCGMPYKGLRDTEQSSCSVECHRAWLKRGRVPLWVALEEEPV